MNESRLFKLIVGRMDFIYDFPNSIRTCLFHVIESQEDSGDELKNLKEAKESWEISMNYPPLFPRILLAELAAFRFEYDNRYLFNHLLSDLGKEIHNCILVYNDLDKLWEVWEKFGASIQKRIDKLTKVPPPLDPMSDEFMRIL